MNLYVMDTNFNLLNIIDQYESLIWTDRYYEAGDFEIYTSIQNGILDIIKLDYFIYNDTSEHLMIVEKIQITSDIEQGDKCIISGKSAESILARRIVWGQKTLSGNLQSAIETLLNEAIISPTDEKRKIDNFIFKTSDDARIASLEVNAQYTGDNLYNVIADMCIEQNIGFKIILGNEKKFEFSLYCGNDRSYKQTSLPYVIFSTNFDNILNGEYQEGKENLKTVTLVGGEGEGAERKYQTTGDETITGLQRRELFTDARDISSSVYEGGQSKTLTPEEYNALLVQRGKENLADYTDKPSFEGETETYTMFKYGTDFFMGDIVQIQDIYGHESRARVSELIISDDASNSLVYPTFTTVDEEDTQGD